MNDSWPLESWLARDGSDGSFKVDGPEEAISRVFGSQVSEFLSVGQWPQRSTRCPTGGMLSNPAFSLGPAPRIRLGPELSDPDATSELMSTNYNLLQTRQVKRRKF